MGGEFTVGLGGGFAPFVFLFWSMVIIVITIIIYGAIADTNITIIDINAGQNIMGISFIIIFFLLLYYLPLVLILISYSTTLWWVIPLVIFLLSLVVVFTNKIISSIFIIIFIIVNLLFINSSRFPFILLISLMYLPVLFDLNKLMNLLYDWKHSVEFNSIGKILENEKVKNDTLVAEHEKMIKDKNGNIYSHATSTAASFLFQHSLHFIFPGLGLIFHPIVKGLIYGFPEKFDDSRLSNEMRMHFEKINEKSRIANYNLVLCPISYIFLLCTYFFFH
ncbi:MAG: hypothetical protein ACYC49_09415 [Ignavibacteriaceae bacterium]